MAPLSSRQINCRRTDADGRRRDLIRQAEAAAGRELGGRRTLPLSPSSDALPSENYNEVKVGGERRRRSQVIRYANEAPVSRDVRIADLKRLATGRGGGPFRDLLRNHECPPRLWTFELEHSKTQDSVSFQIRGLGGASPTECSYYLESPLSS